MATYIDEQKMTPRRKTHNITRQRKTDARRKGLHRHAGDHRSKETELKLGHLHAEQAPDEGSAANEMLTEPQLSSDKGEIRRRLAEAQARCAMLQAEVDKTRAELNAKYKIAETLGAAMDALRAYTETRLSHFRPLDTDAFEQAYRLVEIERPRPANDLPPWLSARDYLLLRLGEIVEVFRNRYAKDSNYFERIGQGVQFARSISEQAHSAADQIDRLDGVISGLDIIHRRRLNNWLRELSLGEIKTDDIKAFSAQLRRCESVMNHVHQIVEPMAEVRPRGVTAGFKKISARGRPALPYFDAALDLVDLWENVTGRKATYPQRYEKGRDKDLEKQATQNSTRFVELALRMIDPSVKISEVVTYLRNTFTYRSNWRAEMAKYPDVSGFTGYLVRRGQEEGLIDDSQAASLIRAIEANQPKPPDPSDLDTAAEFASKILAAFKPSKA